MLFEIENLSCKYPGSDVEVLFIEKLILQKGKLTFLLGESGIGKSTLLETLGMMNNTLNDVSVNKTVFNFYPKGEMKANLLRYWEKQNTPLIDELRNNCFSFVFQNNNLMDSFSAIENVMLSSLIQGKSYPDSNKVANESFAKFFKNDQLYQLKDKQTKLLSGGQKQRVAFARAFAKDFVVLFGDEPTGNLDPVNADNLLTQLKKEITGNDNKGAVIVSHDIERTVIFADEIVTISSSKSDASTKGEIKPENVYTSNLDGKEKLWENRGKAYNNKEMKTILLKIMSQD